jgi:beta-lactam-binding protein with PASTA domain
MISSSAPSSPPVTQAAFRAAAPERQTKAPGGQDSEHTVSRDAKRPDSTLMPEQQLELRELQQTDRKVRAHEMAHIAASGGLASKGATFSYRTGPDGQRYAVGGEVSIDTSAGRTPEETLDKAARIKAAALAPADPSPQDRKVAAMADRMTMQALTEIATREREQPADSAERTSETPADARDSGARISNAYQASGTAEAPGPAINAYA